MLLGLLLLLTSEPLTEATHSALHASLHASLHSSLHTAHWEVLHLTHHGLERLFLLLGRLRLAKSTHHLATALTMNHTVKCRVLVIRRMRVCIVHLIQVLDVDGLLRHIRWVGATLHVDGLATAAHAVSLEVSETTIIIC